MDPYLGEIRMFAGTFAPNGWFNCDGSLLPISQYSALFSLLGNYYGGDGQRTFALPDLRGRAPVSTGQGSGTSNYNLGDAKGAENVTLTPQQMPLHTHVVNVNTTSPTAGLPTNAYLGFNANPDTGDALPFYSAEPTAGAALNAGALTPAGGSQAFSVLQPVLAVTFIIAWSGIYPSRP